MPPTRRPREPRRPEPAYPSRHQPGLPKPRAPGHERAPTLDSPHTNRYKAACAVCATRARRQTLSSTRTTLGAAAALLLMAACGSTGGTASKVTPAVGTPSPAAVTPSPIDTTNMKISVDSTFIKTVTVGTSTNFDMDIQDVGTDDIPNLTILFDAGDPFLDRYTVQTSGPCTVDTTIAALTCGTLAHGTHLKFTISATPTLAGSYVFKWHVANVKQILNEADDNQYVYSWTQTVSS